MSDYFDLEKHDVVRHLLPDPGPEVVGLCLAEIGRLRARAEAAEAACDLWLMDCPECRGEGYRVGCSYDRHGNPEPNYEPCYPCRTTGKVPKPAQGEEG